MSVILSFVLVVLVVDNILGFSFHYRMSNKIDELTKVNSIIQSPLSDSITKTNAVIFRQEILDRKNIFDYLFFRKSSAILKNAQTNNPAQIPKPKESIKNFYIFLISSGGFIVLFGVVMASIDMIYSDEPNMLLRFVASMSFFASPFAIGVTLSTLLNLIPMLGKDWAGNMVLNFTVQTIVLAGILSYFIRYYQDRIDTLRKMKEQIDNTDCAELGHS